MAGEPAVYTLKVVHGVFAHEVKVPSSASVGELKQILVEETSVNPQDQKLIYRGKEITDDLSLYEVGVRDRTKLMLLEQGSSHQRKAEEERKKVEIDKAYSAIAAVKSQVDKYDAQVTFLKSEVMNGHQINVKQFAVLGELLMHQLLALDSIVVEGDVRLQRKAEVKRVQMLVEEVDRLKGIYVQTSATPAAGAPPPRQLPPSRQPGTSIASDGRSRQSMPQGHSQGVAAGPSVAGAAGVGAAMPWNSASLSPGEISSIQGQIPPPPRLLSYNQTLQAASNLQSNGSLLNSGHPVRSAGFGSADVQVSAARSSVSGGAVPPTPWVSFEGSHDSKETLRQNAPGWEDFYSQPGQQPGTSNGSAAGQVQVGEDNSWQALLDASQASSQIAPIEDRASVAPGSSGVGAVYGQVQPNAGIAVPGMQPASLGPSRAPQVQASKPVSTKVEKEGPQVVNRTKSNFRSLTISKPTFVMPSVTLLESPKGSPDSPGSVLADSIGTFSKASLPSPRAHSPRARSPPARQKSLTRSGSGSPMSPIDNLSSFPASAVARPLAANGALTSPTSRDASEGRASGNGLSKPSRSSLSPSSSLSSFPPSAIPRVKSGDTLSGPKSSVIPRVKSGDTLSGPKSSPKTPVRISTSKAPSQQVQDAAALQKTGNTSEVVWLEGDQPLPRVSSPRVGAGGSGRKGQVQNGRSPHSFSIPDFQHSYAAAGKDSGGRPGMQSKLNPDHPRAKSSPQLGNLSSFASPSPDQARAQGTPAKPFSPSPPVHTIGKPMTPGGLPYQPAPSNDHFVVTSAHRTSQSTVSATPAPDSLPDATRPSPKWKDATSPAIGVGRPALAVLDDHLNPAGKQMMARGLPTSTVVTSDWETF